MPHIAIMVKQILPERNPYLQFNGVMKNEIIHSHIQKRNQNKLVINCNQT